MRHRNRRRQADFIGVVVIAVLLLGLIAPWVIVAYQNGVIADLRAEMLLLEQRLEIYGAGE